MQVWQEHRYTLILFFAAMTIFVIHTLIEVLG